MSEVKKVVLAYSDGLDTSIIIPWLKELYNNCEVIAVCGIHLAGETLTIAPTPVSYTHLDVYKRQVQSRSHFLHRPDGALLCGLLRAVHRDRAFDEDAPCLLYTSRCV